MTSTDVLRLITVISSGLTILYIVLKAIKRRRLLYVLILPLTVLTNIFVRYLSIFFFRPLNATGISIYNDWNSLIIIQTIIMIFGMALYLSCKEK